MTSKHRSAALGSPQQQPHLPQPSLPYLRRGFAQQASAAQAQPRSSVANPESPRPPPTVWTAPMDAAPLDHLYFGASTHREERPVGIAGADASDSTMPWLLLREPCYMPLGDSTAPRGPSHC
jgi:hypothetical protein